MADKTKNLGLWTRGPNTNTIFPGEGMGTWDFDANMETLDAAIGDNGGKASTPSWFT